MKVYNNVLEMIGETPMVEFSKLDAGVCQLFGKLESQNPGGSIKDRIAVSMINSAEARGDIKPGDTLIEATAGNTGLGLALVAAQKGYKLKIVLPDKMSIEKAYNLKALGAEVMWTRSDVMKGHPEYYQDMAQRLAQENGWYYINQFGNPDNFKAHFETTGPEIWQQMGGKIDAMVVGVGSGGTVTGIGRYLKQQNPNLEMVLADPEGSILAHYHKTGEMVEAGSWLVEGIGEDFIPDICDMKLFDKAYYVSDKEALAVARDLMLKEAVMGGSSTGTLLAAALKYCQEQTEPKRVVTLVCDTGNRYLSKMYNDDWMKEQGFIE
ncbi:PLP-dependent cysteine synthase family protein [Kangiella sp. TOML190]|uniref:PLP-dependent cysteine synthase family protein n=1 Tax=Kangiella sp. TOML190 TaxID=2931351 RepID=UPI00203FC120|nr:PLP-dependent cysteine synthase family protein [Kangiella sp. TOML190]